MGKWFSRLVLLPLSKLYGLGAYVRNKCFDWHILKEHSFDIPVICVGNLSAGGTGKTPHVEFLVGALSQKYRLAVLSRGYRRSTKGFIMAGRTSTPRDIGDEAYQMYQKFGKSSKIAVCENRVAGIQELLRLRPDLEMIILDDAFQHRYVKPFFSIVIAEYNRPIYKDRLLPYGRLRESHRGLNRADALIVSKCPQNMSAWDFREMSNNYQLFPYQHLYYSRFAYRPLEPVFPDVATEVPYLDWLDSADTILAVAGIGNPRPFVRHIKSHRAKVKVDIYPDHHNYSRKDIEHLLERFNSMKGKKKILVTTEKDAVRLANNPYFPYEMKASTYYLPVEVEFDYTFQNPPPLVSVIERELMRSRADGPLKQN